MRANDPMNKDETSPSIEMARRLLKSAIASQQIEGLELDVEAQGDFQSLVRGQVTPAELRQLLLARYAKPST